MRAVLLYNRQAGQRDRGSEMKAAADRLCQAGWEVDAVLPASHSETEDIARSAVGSGVDVLVVAGGDGTLNGAIQALAHQPTALGVLPVGTTNVWAREMGIPLDVRAATEALIHGEVARVDLGRANNRYFLFVASVGFDALVTREVSANTKRRLGVGAYLIAALVEAFKLRGTEATIVVDGKVTRRRLLMLVANNIRLYGGLVKMAPDAYADDGLLDLCIFQGHGVLTAARHLANVLLGRHTRDPEATCLHMSMVSVNARSSMPVQLDGDYYGTTPVTFRAVPGALRAIVPPGSHPQLRSRAEAIATTASR